MKKKNLKVTVGKFLHRHGATLLVMAVMFMMVMSTVYASPAPTPTKADELWEKVAGTISTWVTRLGGVVCFVGGIMFAMGWKSDDAEQKSRGISTLVAGAMVIAIAAMAGTFFGI